MSGDHGHVVAEDGARLFYERVGERDPVLLVLNGFYMFEDFSGLADDRTVVGLDLRNRGRSEPIRDAELLARGVEQDADDVEAARRHLGVERLDLLAHSYAATIPILYAQRYPSRVGRIVQIGPMPPESGRRYPEHLTHRDGVLDAFAARAGKLQERRGTLSPVELCREFWALLRPIYVFRTDDAEKIRHWEGCDLATERGFMGYWTEFLLPSIERLAFTKETVANVAVPVLVIHGMKDRSSAYGAGRDWALRLPNARLLSVEDAAHAPWVEAPGAVEPAIRGFLHGSWPSGAEQVEAL